MEYCGNGVDQWETDSGGGVEEENRIFPPGSGFWVMEQGELFRKEGSSGRKETFEEGIDVDTE